MAIAVIIEFPGARRANYEKSVQLILKGRKNKLADWPVKGVLAHIAGPIPGGWRVIDVWRSRAAFTRFGKTLKPVLRRVGLRKAPKAEWSWRLQSSSRLPSLFRNRPQRVVF